MTGSTGDEIQLVGALVAQPTTLTTGSDVYLFRGNVIQLAGTAGPAGSLPWGLPQAFLAEVLVQQDANTGSLTVVFVQPEKPVTVKPATLNPSTTTPAAGTTSSTGTSPTGAPATTASSSTTSPSANSLEEGPSVLHKPQLNRWGMLLTSH